MTHSGRDLFVVTVTPTSVNKASLPSPQSGSSAKPVWWRRPCTQGAGAGTPGEAAGTRAAHPTGAQHPKSIPGAPGIPRNPPQHREQPHSGIWAEQRSDIGVRGRISSVPGVNQREKSKMLLSQREKLGVSPPGFSELGFTPRHGSEEKKKSKQNL
uniref:Uncharacterized protein n=1 Tax=Geospiza parvula TaxID=87175 RepID=A0A8C3MDA0_GEOPR